MLASIYMKSIYATYLYYNFCLPSAVPKYRHQLLFGQAISNYFITIWGGNWSGSSNRTILFCFGVIVVYITPSKLQKSYLQILSTLLQNWIFLSRSCHHFPDPVVFYLLQLQTLQHLHSIYKSIKSGH